MLLRAVEPPWHEKTPGRLGTTDRPTPLHRKTEPRKMKLDEDRERLVLLEQILEQDLPYPPGGSVRRRAREVHRQIVRDAEPEQPVSHFP